MSEEPFQPRPAMRRYAAACADPDIETSPEARLAAARVTAAQAARWRKRPGFAEWLGGEVRRLLRVRMWEVWAVVFRAARGGNLTAAKLLTDRLAQDESDDEAAPRTFRELALLAQEYESQLDEPPEDACGDGA